MCLVSRYDCHMAAIGEFSDDFPQYMANTARELAEMARRTERTIERKSVIVAGLQRESRVAAEALRTVASGLHDFSETSYEATNRATEALVEACEQSKGEMRRLAELSDMLAAYLSASRDEKPEPGDEAPE